MVSPKIPYSGFSPVRLKGWNIGRGLPRCRVCLRPSCGLPPSRFPAQCQGRWVNSTPPCERFSALPQGPSLRSGLCCPSPSSLNWPHAPHSQAHPDFAARRFIRDIFAVPDLHRPRRPTSGSELSSMLFRNMSSSTTTGNSSAACTQSSPKRGSAESRRSETLRLFAWWHGCRGDNVRALTSATLGFVERTREREYEDPGTRRTGAAESLNGETLRYLAATLRTAGETEERCLGAACFGLATR